MIADFQQKDMSLRMRQIRPYLIGSLAVAAPAAI
jgi:hypothetical protein